jgi:hypothetical protein
VVSTSRRSAIEGEYAVTASGSWRNADVAGDYTLILGETEVAIATPGGAQRVPLPLGTLSGVRWQGGELTLSFADGTLVLAGEGRLAAVARDIIARATAPGELTLGLRALGSHRRGGGDELQRRYFEPLLSARRRLDRANDPAAQLTALDARALLDGYHDLAHRIAQGSAGEAPSDRRALEAQIDDALAPLVASLNALDRGAQELRAAPADKTIARWREWASLARHVYSAADRCWPEVRDLVTGWHPGPRPTLWRRMLGRAR